MNSCEDYVIRLGNNLGTTVSMYNQTSKELKKLDKDVAKITSGKSTFEPLQLDKPVTEE
jgi:hypothetical protein